MPLMLHNESTKGFNVGTLQSFNAMCLRKQQVKWG